MTPALDANVAATGVSLTLADLECLAEAGTARGDRYAGLSPLHG